MMPHNRPKPPTELLKGAQLRVRPLVCREGVLTLLFVLTVHCGLGVWIATGSSQVAMEIDPPAIQGILVSAHAVPAAVAAPPVLQESRPVQVRSEIRSQSTPKLKPSEPAPVPVAPPRPMAESKEAITVPQATPDAPPASRDAEGFAPTDMPVAQLSQQSGSPGPSVSSAGEGSAVESDVVVPPRVDASHLDNPDPEYPPRSQRLGEEGQVLLDVHILSDGSVKEAHVRTSSGFPRLDEAALVAVRHWRYVPAKQGRKPIAYWYVQPIVFSLSTSR